MYNLKHLRYKFICLSIEFDAEASCGCLIEKDNLCLYGLQNETWEVNLLVEEVPPEILEPTLGINFARDGMEEKDWLSLVAVHSDSWLLVVSLLSINISTLQIYSNTISP